jgi:hypothetical protein
MKFKLEEAIPILERTPTVLSELLLNLPAEWTKRNEGPDTWSPFDVIGHLIHGEETDWMPRAQIILEHGAARPFDPFDRFAQLEKSAGRSLNELLQTFGSIRQTNLQKLASLKISEEQLDKKGMHPELGVVTLGQLLATWVVHDLSHIAQITRVMCKQYGDEVGPWKAYLPILSK